MRITVTDIQNLRSRNVNNYMMDHKELQKLAETLESITPVSLAKDKKSLLRDRIMSRVSPEAALVSEVVKLGEQVLISRTTKAVIKERVMERISEVSQRGFSWDAFWDFNKRMMSMATAFLLVFGTFSYLNFQGSVVSASGFINAFEGGVTLYRGGEAVKVNVGLALEQGDTLVTAADGNVEMYFFDSAKTHLAPNTEVIVKQLLAGESDSKVDNSIQLDLVNGRVWSKVLNVVEEENSPFVLNVGGASVSTNKGAFDVKADAGQMEIGVFNHSVDVKTEKGIEKLASGKKFLIAEDKLEVSDIPDAEKQIAWVQDNLADDKEYVSEVEKKLLVAKLDTLGIETDDDFDFEQSLSEKTLSFLTFSDVDTKKHELEIAESNFLLAQAKLSVEGVELTEEEKTAAYKALKYFEEVVKSSYDFADEIALTDKVYGDEFKLYVDEKIKGHKEVLVLSLPDSPVYGAKEILNELQLDSTDDPAKIAVIKAEQLEEKLSEAEDVQSVADADLKSDIAELKALVDKVDEKTTVDPALVKTIENIEKSVGTVEPVVAPVNTIKQPEVLPEGGAVEEGPFGSKIQDGKVLSPLL